MTGVQTCALPICSSQKDSTKLIDLIRAHALDKDKTKEISGLVEAVYYNISMAIYQIQYHIDNGDNLNVEKITGELARNINDDINKKLNEICTEAKEIGLEEVNRRHYKT